MDTAIDIPKRKKKNRPQRIPRWFMASFVFLLFLNLFQFTFSVRYQFYHLIKRIESDIFEPMELRRGLSNQEIVVQSDRDGKHDVYLVKFNGNGSNYEMTNLTADLDGESLHPVWSPDGQWIAFTYRTGGEIYEIGGLSLTDTVYIMRADGSEKSKIAQGASPSWSEDSKTVYFTRLRSVDTLHWGDIIGYHLDSGEETTVMDIESCNCYLAVYATNIFSNWQQHGDTALFQVQSGNWYPAVYSKNLTTGNVFHLAGDYSNAASDPAWSAYGIGTFGQTFHRSWISRANDGSLVVPGGSPTWSPDAQYLMYDALLSGEGIGNYGLIMLKSGAHSIEPRVIMKEEGVNISQPSWRPGN